MCASMELKSKIQNKKTKICSKLFNCENLRLQKLPLLQLIIQIIKCTRIVVIFNRVQHSAFNLDLRNSQN